MELKKIKKIIERFRQEEKAKARESIKKIDFTKEAYFDRWARCSRWNGGEIYTDAKLTQRDEGKTPEEKRDTLIKKELKSIDKNFDKKINNIKEFEAVAEIPERLELSIDWTASRTWGANPRGTLRAVGFGYYEGGSIGGCGYDKRSAAAAEVLQKSKELKAAAFALLETFPSDYIRKALKYGDIRADFGYGLHFSFDGVLFGSGCGIESIFEELKALGYACNVAHMPRNGGEFYLFEINPKNANAKKIGKVLRA